MILNWLKTRKELDVLFCVPESFKWSLRKEKVKTIVCIVCETMIDFERVGTYKSEIMFI